MSGGNSTGQLEKARKGKAPGIRAGRDFRRGTGPSRTEASRRRRFPQKLNRAGETHSPSRQDAKRTHAPGPHKRQEVYTMTEKMIENRIKKLQAIEAQREEVEAVAESIRAELKADLEAKGEDEHNTG